MFGVLWWKLQFPLIFKTYYSIYLADEAASENLIFNTKPVNNPILEFPTKTQWMIVLKKLKPFSMNLNILDIQNGARKRMPRTFLIRLKTPKKRLNLTNRLSLDIGANVRTKSQPRRRFFWMIFYNRGSLAFRRFSKPWTVSHLIDPNVAGKRWKLFFRKHEKSLPTIGRTEEKQTI